MNTTLTLSDGHRVGVTRIGHGFHNWPMAYPERCAKAVLAALDRRAEAAA